VTTVTMPAPVPEARALEQLEAEFLHGTVPAGLPGAETLAPDIWWPVGDEPQAARTTVKTRTGCCM
jgi:hypothetical protein